MGDVVGDTLDDGDKNVFIKRVFYDFEKNGNIMADSLSYAGKGVILASQSPRRKQLLEWAEVPFEIIIKPTDELYPADLSVEAVAMHIARNKAIAVKDFVQATAAASKIIIAADTIVVIDNEIIGKPLDRQHAIEILNKLSGKTHNVITGVVLMDANKEIIFSDTTEVTFYPLSAEAIAFYVDKYAPYDKAGAYAIQEWIGVVGIQSVKGDFYNVMGLPVSKVVQAIAEW
jgi:septum formation protein